MCKRIRAEDVLPSGKEQSMLRRLVGQLLDAAANESDCNKIQIWKADLIEKSE